MIKSIIISGPPAIGKTTIAKGLAKEFDIEYLSGGDILKDLAGEQGFQTQGEDWWDTRDGINFLGQRKKNPEFDKNVDNKLKELEAYWINECAEHPSNNHCKIFCD